MTVSEFQDRYCSLCGTQSCMSEPEDISGCGHYHGEIEGIPKVKTAMDLFEALLEELGLTWEDLAREIEGGLNNVLGASIDTDA